MALVHRPRTPSPERRRFLRAAGAVLALPALERFAPSRAAAAQAGARHGFVAICNNLGMLPENFFPKAAGRGYQPSPYLEMIARHQERFTVMSGVWHPDVDGGHPADNCFLTAAPHPSSGGFRNTVSLDQHIAQHIGHLTRFPSLTVGVNVEGAARSLSWTPGGVLIPCEQSPAGLYKKLFVQGNAEEVRQQIQRLELGRSILDAVGDQSRGLGKTLGARDRERLDQYATGVRDLERRLVKAREWENVPKKTVKALSPTDPDSPRRYLEKTKLMFDLAALALETDSTRLITIMLDAVSSPVLEVEGAEIKEGYHSLSHHGKNPGKLAQLEAIERGHVKLLGELLDVLVARKLLDRTMVLYGSNLGNANTHVTTNLPILLAGGGFAHGQHLVFDTTRNYPLPNLFVNVLQRFGLEEERFASSTGTMRGIEPA